ncbi:hypothetical protein [Pelagibius sp.]|uniref:hypothetical protein n=1 Tax=Pelagibius sp. TaxID=1931238 RepID=UPI00260D938A|nr:hypothetical protein [Pelagibius sp.]
MKVWMLATTLAATLSLVALPQSGHADGGDGKGGGGGWVANGTALTGLERTGDPEAANGPLRSVKLPGTK